MAKGKQVCGVIILLTPLYYTDAFSSFLFAHHLGNIVMILLRFWELLDFFFVIGVAEQTVNIGR